MSTHHGQGWLSNTPSSYQVMFNQANKPYFVHKNARIPDDANIGGYSYFHGNIRVTGSKDFYVGAFCSIASDVTIHCGDNHNTEFLTTYPFKTILGFNTGLSCAIGDGVHIGSDVWIGEGARLLPGSYIGSGAVIGAGAVIRGEVPPYSVMIGNPAVAIRFRFPQYVIKELLRLEWWTWSLERIQKNIDLFSVNLRYISQGDFLELLSTVC